MAKFCPSCGRELVEGESNCSGCGAPVAQVTETVSPAQPSVVNASTTTSPVANDTGSEQKSKLAAGLLGIFLGGLGVHNFYLGNTGKAVTQLLISLLSCGFLAVVSSIWGLVEGILILTGSINVDGKGVPLKD